MKPIKSLLLAEQVCLITHILAMIFGLAGLLLVVPHPEFILSLPQWGQQLFQLSMGSGGVVYIVLGAVAIALYGWRIVGPWKLWGFVLPAVGISLTSELLGTSTGFPFGHYSYLSGLGYKIAGLVPFTIPLSWFYMGFITFLLAYSGVIGAFIRQQKKVALWAGAATVALAAVFLTAWDFVLDPAMSQAAVPFWQFQEVGAFFGMPYRNILGWAGTGAVFMAVAMVTWWQKPILLVRSQLTTPLVVYLVNFAFGAMITLTSLDERFWIPASLGFLMGVLPVVLLWAKTPIVLPTLATELPPASANDILTVSSVAK
ncbi:carotenoid biosynthesis protein [Candidatus Synechococcus calcipolaris G9]|uniref:Carotenoid biosynthesis protein n=1 Tax=Candidatus Synechococcus calcipolaris G9 TaxID=1497997 RepID=A0ABT6F0S5_9SYNE|nr:carotenoid biosynthesis protein [Candidatus Synechococcus calcipolaris]MDG2991459.1 carotenoid biosynthesis protein [Candidatus Synechococcus calcipolaris G9]